MTGDDYKSKAAEENGCAWTNFGGFPRIIRRFSRENEIYLIRFTLFNFFGVQAMLHVFMSSDPDALHDHPFHFVSFMLAGRYLEDSQDRRTGKIKRTYRKAPSVIYRRAKHKHRVILAGAMPCVTLVFRWRRCREWGFWTRLCGWVPWYDFEKRTHECD